MSINLYSVQNHLTEEGWQLLSDSYKNLNTELEMLCPQGHKIYKTYGDWRKHPVCDLCLAGDPFKIKKNKVPIKKIDTQRILALDAATIITGFAIYDDTDLVSYGTYKVDSSLSAEERINKMKQWLRAAIVEWKPDFVGLENIQLQNYGANNSQTQVKTFQTLANLQGVLIDTLYESELAHDLVYSSSWRKYCDVGDGRGRENKKKAAQEKVKLWYNQDCTQDEADAICIGKYFVHSIRNTKTTWGEDI